MGQKKMKRNKIILFLVLFLIPTIVKADMGGPIFSYKVRISNLNGAYSYDYDFDQSILLRTEYKIEYDTIATVSDEILFDEEFYAYICIDDNCGYINLSNTSSLDVDLNDYYNKEANTYYIFGDSCYLYEGPSFNVYNKIFPEEKLDIGYTFTSNYYDDLWAYVPEKNAWIYTYNMAKRFDEEPAEVMLKIPNTDTNILTMKEVNIYNNPYSKDTVLGTIPINTELTSNYYYGNYSSYYVTYNGISGFIILENYNNIPNLAFGYNATIKVGNSSGIKLYKDGNLNSEVIDIIPFNTELIVSYDLGERIFYMYRVEYNNKIGWINVSDLDNSTSEDYFNSSDNSEDNTDNSNNEENEEPDFVVDPSTSKLSTNQVIVLCIVLVIIVSLTAFVTILLINKKKESRNAKNAYKDIK